MGGQWLGRLLGVDPFQACGRDQAPGERFVGGVELAAAPVRGSVGAQNSDAVDLQRPVPEPGFLLLGDLRPVLVELLVRDHGEYGAGVVFLEAEEAAPVGEVGHGVGAAGGGVDVADAVAVVGVLVCVVQPRLDLVLCVHAAAVVAVAQESERLAVDGHGVPLGAPLAGDAGVAQEALQAGEACEAGPAVAAGVYLPLGRVGDRVMTATWALVSLVAVPVDDRRDSGHGDSLSWKGMGR